MASVVSISFYDSLSQTNTSDKDLHFDSKAIRSADFVFAVLINPLTGCIAVICNCIIVRVAIKHKKSNPSSRFYMASVAIGDIVSLSFILLISL